MLNASPARRFAIVALAVFVGGLFAVSCGGGDGDDDNPMEPDPSVASVSVSPAEDSIGAGETATFSASAQDADGENVSADFSWSSTSTSVATVDDQGVATGQADGMAQIVASAEGVADSAELTVAGEAEPRFEVGDNYFEDPQGRRNTDASVELTLGQSVTWEWVGSNQHNVTSGEGQGGGSGDGVPDNGTAVSSPTQTSGTYEFTPDVEGTWEFYCGVHPDVMYGSTFTVTSSGSSSVAADAGSGRSSDIEPGDVIRPEGTHLVLIYRGKEGGSE